MVVGPKEHLLSSTKSIVLDTALLDTGQESFYKLYPFAIIIIIMVRNWSERIACASATYEVAMKLGIIFSFSPCHLLKTP